MSETYPREWLGWTEADHYMLAILYGWGTNPSAQGIQDSLEFLSIVLYCTRTRPKSA